MGESVEQCHTHLELRHLTLKGFGHHTLTQSFEAMHLSLDQAVQVVAAPLLSALLYSRQLVVLYRRLSVFLLSSALIYEAYQIATCRFVQQSLYDAQNRQVGTATARRTVDFGGGFTIGAWKRIYTNVADDVVDKLAEQLK